MWVIAWLAKGLLLEYGPRVVATLLIALFMLVSTTVWSMTVMMQPGGIYWMAAQSHPESQPPSLSQSQPASQGQSHPESQDKSQGFAPAAPVIQLEASREPSERIQSMLTYARTWLGTPYFWGGCTKKGVDCSCFVMNALSSIGISAPRTTVPQLAWTRPVSQPQPGDLVFFDNTCQGCGANPTHVGMVIGGGQMIDAGDPVKIESYETPYWRTKLRSFGRPPGL